MIVIAGWKVKSNKLNQVKWWLVYGYHSNPFKFIYKNDTEKWIPFFESSLPWHSIWHIYSDILSGILSGIYSEILSIFYLAFYLAAILTFYLASCARGWGPAMPTEIWRSPFGSGTAHWHLALVVEVQQCPLRSGARGWGRGGEEEKRRESLW